MANGKNGKNGSALGMLCEECEAIGTKGKEGAFLNACIRAAEWAEAHADEVATDEARKAVAASVAKAYATGRGDMRATSIEKWSNQADHFMREKARKVAARIVKEVKVLADKTKDFRKFSGQDWQEASLKAVRALNKADKPVTVTPEWVRSAVKKTGGSNRGGKQQSPTEKAEAAMRDALKLLAVKMTPSRKVALAAFEKAFGIHIVETA